MSKGKYYFSKSLEKGLRILALFDGETPVVNQSMVAKKLGLNMTSTYRYINTLVEMGYLDKNPRTKEIRPAIQCLLMCVNMMQATDNLKIIRQVVDDIHSAHNISIDVAIAVEDTLVRIYHREAQEALTYSLPESSKNCLHNTALGKACLASLPDEEMVDKIKTMVLVAKTEKTIVDKDRLIDEIRLARDRGFAMQEEEYLPGVLAIAAPLYDPVTARGLGAVSFDFSVLEHSTESIRQQYGGLIAVTAETISKLLPPVPSLRQQ